MSDTLKDVVSLQRIEEGLMVLEMGTFKPDLLLTNALTIFQ